MGIGDLVVIIAILYFVIKKAWDIIARFYYDYKVNKAVEENTWETIGDIKVPEYKEPLERWPKIIKFIYWVIYDLRDRMKNGAQFTEYGVTVYTGRQGSGKTIGMVNYLERMRKKYPKAMIITNFGYIHEYQPMTTWKQIFEIRNGRDGVIFAIDELQNEYSSTAWDKFPEGLLQQVTMQRKQKIKIVSTSQVFTRVVKALREQTYEVVECKTWLQRWTICKGYDADDYNAVVDDPEKRRKLWKKWKVSFVQDEKIRELYDTELVIKKMEQYEVPSRSERKVRELIG